MLVSLVRTTSPGFLKSTKRINVLLTRCKQAMIIACNRTFITTRAKKTLVGKMALHWEKIQTAHDGASPWISWLRVADAKADLPGVSLADRPRPRVPAPRPISLPAPSLPNSHMLLSLALSSMRLQGGPIASNSTSHHATSSTQPIKHSNTHPAKVKSPKAKKPKGVS